jgi:hypothetical protein
MSFLEIFFIISGIIILLSAINVARQERFNALHFLVFIGIGGWLIIFTLFPNVLYAIGTVFWLQRGSDLLVYTSIIFLIYCTLLLFRKIDQQNQQITKLIREIAFIKNEHENR